MTRPTSAALHLWQIPGRPDGDVRLLAPSTGKRSYRIVWRENGQQRERTSTDLETAMTLGLDQATQLACVPGEPSRHAPFAEALEYHLDFERRGARWSVKYQRRLSELVRRWLDDDFLTLPCLAFEGPDGGAVVMDLLDRLQAAGYPRGSHEYEQMGALLSGLFKSGIAIGYFTTNPMTGVKYSVSSAHNHDGGRFANVRPIAAEESPPSARIDQHIAASPLLTGRWWEGLPAAVMAYGGLRIEEALALEPHHVLADTPGLLVAQQLLELRASDKAGKPGMTLTDPKGGRSRETFLSPHVWEQVQRRAEEVRDQAGKGVDGHQPLFPAPRGGWQRADNYRFRIFVPTSKKVGWPRLADADARHRTWQWTPHSLRHHYANWTLKDLALPPTVVAGYMGHSSADVTERMYLHRERSDLNRGLAAYLERNIHV
jgi:integrase